MPTRVLLHMGTDAGFAAGVLRGITRHQAGGADWDARRVDNLDRNLQLLRRWRPQGIISLSPAPVLIALQRRLRCPLVSLDGTHTGTGLPRILVDETAVGAMAARHFLAHGLRHLATSGFTGIVWLDRRFAGFAACAAQAGVVVTDRRWGARGHRTNRTFEFQGEAAVARWLRSMPRPCGILAASDQHAVVLARVARAHGLAVPDEIAVLGANDDELVCGLAIPPIASIRIPTEAIGQRAATLLSQLMAGKPPPSGDLLIAPSGISDRRSADVQAIEDPAIARLMRAIQDSGKSGARVEALITAAGCSRRTAERRMRQLGLGTPGGHLRRSRLDEACRLLADTTLPLADIAVRCGMASAASLIKAFRATHGCTPGAWRRQQG